MARKPYYTLCIWNEARQQWFGEVTFASRDDADSERRKLCKAGMPKPWMKVLVTDGTQRRRALPRPRKPRMQEEL